MKVDITALNLLTIDLIYSELDRLPGLGEEISTPRFSLALGGGPVAALVAASRLGAKVKLATSLGTDRFSDIARGFLAEEGLPYQSFDTVLHTGHSLVNISSVMSLKGSDRSFISYFPDTTFYTSPTEEVFQALREGAYCIATVPNADLFRRLKAAGCRIAYDVSWSDGLCVEALAEALSSVYLFTPNEKEALKLTGTGDAQAALLQLKKYVEQPIVKLGKDGAIFLRGDKIVHCPPFAFSAIDTTGAGDAFLGGVLYGLSQGWDMMDCVRLGNYTGGKATTGIGCMTARPSMEEYEALCSSC